MTLGTGARRWAIGLFTVVVVSVVVMLAGALHSVSSFVGAWQIIVANGVIAVSCGIGGVLIAWNRPDNRLGWLLLGAGR